MTRRERLVLLASTIGFSMVLLDTTVVNVALGSIARDLSAGPTTLEWVANAYTLVFAGLLLSTGLAADRLGARAVFLAGLGTFAAGSVAATLAPTAAALIAAQALLGVGAALVLPTSLSLLSQVFEDPARRVRAVSVWAAGSAVSFATGPVLGGLLIEQAGWRSIFVINLPLAAVAAALVLSQVGGRGRRRGAAGRAAEPRAAGGRGRDAARADVRARPVRRRRVGLRPGRLRARPRGRAGRRAGGARALERPPRSFRAR